MSEPKRPNILVFNDALLKGFVNGTLEPAVEEKVANFIESRPDLLEKISAKSGDGFLKRLREVQQRSAEKSPSTVNAKIVQPTSVKKVAANNETSVPAELANYAGYRISKELGRGGMGVVYLAKNIQMDRLEVLKVLNERLLNHEGAKERFLREIRAVSKLSHTNIVTSYSILPLDNQLVFAMEYVHGVDLQQYTHKYKPLPVGLACSFAKQIAAGLEHAHEKGLVHRDIKPSNVIVYKSGGQLQLKILDFGLAKATSEEAAKGAGLTQDGTMLGTPEYMSPEQTMNAAKADIRADIYSLGCTLYYMLAGKPPFTGTHGAVLVLHAQREPTAINLIRPDVPAELVAVVGKMLAKDLRKRYQTPSEVAQALLPFVNQTRSAANKSVGAAAVTNTVNNLNGPDRETSVESPLSELSLDASIQSEQPEQSLAVLAASLKEKRTASQIQPSPVRKKAKPRSPRWFLPTVIGLGMLIFLGSAWQLAGFIFRTPKGTIVVENMPADAEVFVDGQKFEIVWNAGKDKAEVSIDAGTHQLRVLNQGNEIYGEKVTVRGKESTAVKLSIASTSLPSPGMQPKSIEYVTLGPVDKEERLSPGKVDAIAPREFTETPSGLKYRILRQGNGKKPTAKSDVVAHYKGWLDDQTIFDSTYRKGESMPFSLTSVIKGWSEGVPLISEGGMIELSIPPALGYGSKGTSGGPIPPDAQLHFIIELTAVNTNAAASQSRPADAANSDWQSLFNGIDLAGWKGDSRYWSVRDGCITGKLDVNNNLKANTCLIWDGAELGDFVVEYECAVSSEGNSGLQVRSKIVDAQQFVLGGYQADVDGKANFTGALYEERGRGILANLGEIVTFDPSGTKSINSIADGKKLKFGISGQGWNYYRVVAKGNNIQYYVNSTLMSEIIDRDASKAAARGVLGLQLHTGKGAQVQFKSIRLKQL